MHFFTSITANYLPKARVLAKSLKKYNSDAVFHLVFADSLPAGFDLRNEPFDAIIKIEDLGIPDSDAWIFKHSVVELCTAIKGPAFKKLFDTTDADKVVYFDPDIVVLHHLAELSDMLESSSVILTPHLVEPDQTDEAIMDNEICSLKHGIYNLGFLAVRRCADGLKFIEWWKNRLLKYCYDDIPNGLFTDQRWIDLAPAFFDNIFILRDKSYNIATWNLSHRPVYSGNDGNLFVEGSPIKFFHFSGFDSGAQEIMLKKYGNNNPALKKLRERYMSELDNEGQREFGNLPCCYSFYSNGELIRDEHRRLYRSRLDLMQAFPQPAAAADDKLCYLNWLKQTYIHESPRPDDAKSRELEIILNSTSWKITRPMRMISGYVKKMVKRD